MKFYDDMTREEIYEAYANEEGRKYEFTDKDWAWSCAKENATGKTDAELLSWCEENFG